MPKIVIFLPILPRKYKKICNFSGFINVPSWTIFILKMSLFVLLLWLLNDLVCKIHVVEFNSKTSF